MANRPKLLANPLELVYKGPAAKVRSYSYNRIHEVAELRSNFYLVALDPKAPGTALGRDHRVYGGPETQRQGR